MKIKAIETFYNGYRFRSRLEARWAVFFDHIGIKYLYEPEGYKLSDGTMYLPDFYLPESDSFFEVKGVMTDIDRHKIEQFIKESDKAVTIGYGDFRFEACDFWGDEGIGSPQNDYASLCICRKCGKKWFMGMYGIWTCRCCGEYSGDQHFYEILNGDNGEPEYQDVEEAIKAAKQARFEHGETPAVPKQV